MYEISDSYLLQSRAIPMRFIGSKKHLIPFIESTLHQHVKDGPFCIGDIFSGSACVSRHFKQRGNKVIANDTLKFCYVLAKSALEINDEPSFEKLIETETFIKKITGDLHTTPYDRVLKYLNEIPNEKGFFYREYSPGGTANNEFQRRYFTDENAMKIDAIRTKIKEWQNLGLLNEVEVCLLLSDLIRATNRIANIAGTYGCFIKSWDPRAHKHLILQRSPIIPSSNKHKVFCEDANILVKDIFFDVMYLDPPYTWRHYGAYYHILETIAEGDEPVVKGRTGLRNWQEKKSRYCDRTKASDALNELVYSAKCNHLFMSYSSEGLIDHKRILEIISQRGEPIYHETIYRRYRSNGNGNKSNSVKERLYYVKISQTR